MAKKSTASAASDKKVRRVRNTIIIASALIVGIVVGYGILYSTGVTDKMTTDGYSEGKQYSLLDDVEPRRPGTPVVISEYFSYGCIHCKNFDPLVVKFEPTLPPGSRLDQVPVTFNQSWALLARAHLALKSIDGLKTNHDRLFTAIHSSGRQFSSAEQIADFVDGKDGVTKESFMTAFDSGAVRRRLSKIDAGSRNLGITSIPALIVDGRYRINMDIGRKQSLEVARFLVEKVLREEGGGAASSETTPKAQPSTTESGG